MATMRTVLVTAAVAAALLTAGCASKPNGTDARSGAQSKPGAAASSSAALTPVPAKNDCSDMAAIIKNQGMSGQPLTSGSLPAGAHPVSLLKCVVDSRTFPGQGRWTVVDTVRSTGSVDSFVSALRAGYVKPPQPTPKDKNYGCAAVGYTEQWVVLIDADGKAYQIKIPFWGVCPMPDPDVMKALNALPTTVASTERIQQTESPAAEASGCPQQFAEMAFVGAQAGGSGPGTSRPFFPANGSTKSLSVCYYKLGSTFDKVKPAGDFEAATTITGSQGAAIYDALMNAPISAGKTCDAPATEYAELTVEGKGWSVVELTGCRLAAPDSGSDRQAPDSVIQALLAAKKQ